jgi:hypothetical protein
MNKMIRLAACVLVVGVIHVLPIITMSAAINCPLPTDCVSQYDYCGQTAAYCGQGCKGGPCWSNAVTPGIAPSLVDPPLDPLAVPRVTTYSGRNWCEVREDFNTSSTSVFTVDYCKNNAQVATSNGTLNMIMTKECGTRLQSRLNYTQGYFEASVRSASTGPGAVTAFILQSNPEVNADELDWEWTGNAPNIAQTNVFVNGVKNHTRATGQVVPGGSQNGYHIYAIEWNQQYVRWLIDNVEKHRIDNDGTQTFPVKPMYVKLGIWDGTDTGGWAGTTDFNKAPFQASFDYVKFGYWC